MTHQFECFSSAIVQPSIPVLSAARFCGKGLRVDVAVPEKDQNHHDCDGGIHLRTTNVLVDPRSGKSVLRVGARCGWGTIISESPNMNHLAIKVFGRIVENVG